MKKLLTSELATSSFARGLSSFDEVVVKVGNAAHYNDSIQLLCGYFVQQKWIAPSVKPVIVGEYCSLVTKFRLDKVDNGSKEWVGLFSRYYELQSRAELFRFFRICCATLRSPCQAPPLLTVSLVGLKSDVSEFNSAVRSLQCSISSIQKIESLFLASTSLPRPFALLDKGPGLMHKRKFSMWNLLSRAIFTRLGFEPHWKPVIKRVAQMMRLSGCQLQILFPAEVLVPLVPPVKLLRRNSQLAKLVQRYDTCLRCPCFPM